MKSSRMGIVLVVFGAMLSFCSSRQTMTTKSRDCTFVQQKFEIDTSGFKEFNSELADFMKSQQDFDALIIEMKGGEHEPSHLNRWTLINGELFKTEMRQGSRNVAKVKSVDIEDVVKRGDTMRLASYMKICPYSSDSNLFLFLISNKNGVIFKYSAPETYKFLEGKNLEQIKGAASIFDLLQNSK
jgi:hypothetical protein